MAVALDPASDPDRTTDYYYIAYVDLIFLIRQSTVCLFHLVKAA